MDRWSQWCWKVTCGNKISRNFFGKNAEYIESDLYWLNLIKENSTKTRSGFDSYINEFFLVELRNVLDEKIQLGKTPIVSMSLVSKLCEMELLDYFETRKIPMIHIILEASKDVTIQRIKNDCIRDQAAQSQQIAKVEWQIDYLKNHMQMRLELVQRTGV